MRGRGGAARVAALALALALCAVPVDALYGEDSAVKLLDGKVPSCSRGSCERFLCCVLRAACCVLLAAAHGQRTCCGASETAVSTRHVTCASSA